MIKPFKIIIIINPFKCHAWYLQSEIQLCNGESPFIKFDLQTFYLSII